MIGSSYSYWIVMTIHTFVNVGKEIRVIPTSFMETGAPQFELLCLFRPDDTHSPTQEHQDLSLTLKFPHLSYWFKCILSYSHRPHYGTEIDRVSNTCINRIQNTFIGAFVILIKLLHVVLKSSHWVPQLCWLSICCNQGLTQSWDTKWEDSTYNQWKSVIYQGENGSCNTG